MLKFIIQQLHDENSNLMLDSSSSDYEGGDKKVHGDMYDPSLKPKENKKKSKDKKSGKKDKTKKTENPDINLDLVDDFLNGALLADSPEPKVKKDKKDKKEKKKKGEIKEKKVKVPK